MAFWLPLQRSRKENEKNYFNFRDSVDKDDEHGNCKYKT